MDTTTSRPLTRLICLEDWDGILERLQTPKGRREAGIDNPLRELFRRWELNPRPPPISTRPLFSLPPLTVVQAFIAAHPRGCSTVDDISPGGGYIPLQYAFRANANLDIIEALIRAGAASSFEAYSALHMAVETRRSDAVKLISKMINEDAHPPFTSHRDKLFRATDDMDNSPLDAACENGDSKSILVLLQAYPAAAGPRSDPTEFSMVPEYTMAGTITSYALNKACGSKFTNAEALCKLVELYPDAVLNEGVDGLPLHSACDGSNSAAVELLLTAYPDGALERNALNELPLHLAAQHTLLDASSLKRMIDISPNALLKLGGEAGLVPLQFYFGGILSDNIQSWNNNFYGGAAAIGNMAGPCNLPTWMQEHVWTHSCRVLMRETCAYALSEETTTGETITEDLMFPKPLWSMNNWQLLLLVSTTLHPYDFDVLLSTLFISEGLPRHLSANATMQKAYAAIEGQRKRLRLVDPGGIEKNDLLLCLLMSPHLFGAEIQRTQPFMVDSSSNGEDGVCVYKPVLETCKDGTHLDVFIRHFSLDAVGRQFLELLKLKPWVEFEPLQDQMDQLLRKYPHFGTLTDKSTGHLYPFMLPALDDEPCLDCTFDLLKRFVAQREMASEFCEACITKQGDVRSTVV
jgi:ankyrin repeat protein